jgi:hypothetical protein
VRLLAEVVVHPGVVVDELRVGLDDADDGDVFEEIGFTGDEKGRISRDVRNPKGRKGAAKGGLKDARERGVGAPDFSVGEGDRAVRGVHAEVRFEDVWDESPGVGFTDEMQRTRLQSREDLDETVEETKLVLHRKFRTPT